MRLVPILWVVNDAKPSQGKTPSQSQILFDRWNLGKSAAGGGYWNDYDIEKMNSSYTAYANVLDTVFG
jgi:hypothetical protein